MISILAAGQGHGDDILVGMQLLWIKKQLTLFVSFAEKVLISTYILQRYMEWLVNGL